MAGVEDVYKGYWSDKGQLLENSLNMYKVSFKILTDTFHYSFPYITNYLFLLKSSGNILNLLLII